MLLDGRSPYLEDWYVPRGQDAQLFVSASRYFPSPHTINVVVVVSVVVVWVVVVEVMVVAVVLDSYANNSYIRRYLKLRVQSALGLNTRRRNRVLTAGDASYSYLEYLPIQPSFCSTSATVLHMSVAQVTILHVMLSPALCTVANACRGNAGTYLLV